MDSSTRSSVKVVVGCSGVCTRVVGCRWIFTRGSLAIDLSLSLSILSFPPHREQPLPRRRATPFTAPLLVRLPRRAAVFRSAGSLSLLVVRHPWSCCSLPTSSIRISRAVRANLHKFASPRRRRVSLELMLLAGVLGSSTTAVSLFAFCVR
ncbi:hypothetical protein Syun_015142 [Stephania yunnanensis]|uniref:Uncharacterized protein n=1 Tax=Stephania yunnanensis TaxID=152371 RepID=A0AAP0JMY1_9MAGN